MVELKAPIPADAVAPLEDYFCELDASPWMLLQAKKDDPHSLSGFFDDEAAGRAEWAALCSRFPQVPIEPEVRPVEDADWQNAYKAHFKPWTEAGLHWVPEWERAGYIVPDGEAAVYIDPGLAFGTGDHPTTRLCAREMLRQRQKWREQEASLDGKSLIDAGCGSGILAISAANLGMRNIYAFDNDPDAVRVAEENAATNGAEEVVDFEVGDLGEALEGRQADIVLANILAHILCANARILLKSINPGGTLALSGILAEEMDEVRGVFEPIAKELGLICEVETEVEGEWCSVIFRRMAAND